MTILTSSSSRRAILSSLVLIGFILLVPVSIYAERKLPVVWSQRLIIPSFEPNWNRHTPRYEDVTSLPTEITADIVLNETAKPYLLTGPTTVAANTALTIDRGVVILASEFSYLNIYGTLAVEGTEQQPVILATNEKHPSNQTWGGIIFQPASTGDLNHARISQAAPGLSCLRDSTVTINETEITLTSAGIYTESERCFLSNSLIRSVGTGLISRGVEPQVTNTIFHSEQEIVRFNLSR